MLKNLCRLESRSATRLLLLSVLTLSAACSFPKIPRSSVVSVVPIPADAYVSAEAGESMTLGPGSAFFGDSYIPEIRKARVSDGRRVLHPITGRDFIRNDSRETVVLIAPKRGWVLSPIAQWEVERIKINPL